MINPRQDVFGYYQVGEFQTYNKFEASVEHGRTGKKLEWIFNDAVYSQVNWKQEPTESLEELYRQRAQDLRDQYDYLVLWYSGGADSQNILDTFLDNNIKLDELASYSTTVATGNQNDFMNGEIYNVAVPTAAKAKLLQPWLIHTIIDQSHIVRNHFEYHHEKLDWVYHCNTYVNPQSMSRPLYIRRSQPHWQKMFDAGKKVGFIYGTDKPRVKGVHGKYYFHFVDMIDAVKQSLSQQLDNAWEFDELFYWSPRHPKIVVKQGHIVKRYLQTITDTSPDTVIDLSQAPPDNGFYNATTYRNQMVYSPVKSINALIYPKWHPVPYQFKPNSAIFTYKDNWFFAMSENEKAKHAWRTGLEHRWRQTPDALKVDPKSLSQGFRHINSRYYQLNT